MSFKKTAVASLVGAAIALPSMVSAAGLEWYGSVYMKFLDGNRNANNGMYSLGGTYPGAPSGGDLGQAAEVEFLFKSQVSQQVEMGGRLKGRFNRNYWANGGGFGADEHDSLSSEYLKVRGYYVTLTPGYDWIDSFTLGSNDWGQFDPYTIGKLRYEDRDNVKGFLGQGSFGDFRWDVARVSLPKLWAGPGWDTTAVGKNDANAAKDPDNESRLSYESSLFGQDAAWGFQLRYSGSDVFNYRLVASYVLDEELDPTDTYDNNGRETEQRVENTVIGGVANITPTDGLSIKLTGYASNYNVDTRDSFYQSVSGGFRWTPYLNDDAEDWIGKINVDWLETPIEGFSLSAELFRIGAEYQSIMASRREADVLLTEGFDGAWMIRNRSEGGLGLGGWNGNAQQLATLNIDNEFSDFDGVVGQTAIGWQGITIVPSLSIADWDLSGEFTYLDYDTNWQAFGDGTLDPMQSKYPMMEGDSSMGLGGGFRDAYQPFQDRETYIFVFKAATIFDIGDGLDYKMKLKFIDESDNRLEDVQYLNTYYAQNGVGLTSTAQDNRDFEYLLFENGIGYQLTDDLYGRLTHTYYDIDVIDGDYRWAPPIESCGGWTCNYETGEHERHSLMLQFDYFLSGLEVGSTFQWIHHEYTPKFVDYSGQGSADLDAQIASGDVTTGFGSVSTDEQRFQQYRMKTWVKVKF